MYNEYPRKKNPFIVDLPANWWNLMKQSMTLSYLVCIDFVFQNFSLKMLKNQLSFCHMNKSCNFKQETRKYNYFFQSVEIGIFVCCKSSLVVVYVHKLGFKNLAILNVVRGYIFNIPQYSDVL